MNDLRIPVALSRHVRRLFLEATGQTQFSNDTDVADPFLQTLPTELRFRVMGKHNSVGIALGSANRVRLSAVETELKNMVERTAIETGFKFTNQQIDSVCAADRMAALLFSISRSGHVRQAGLSKIDGLGPEIGFGLILRRLNDWVPEVRAEARRTVRRLLNVEGYSKSSATSLIAEHLWILLNERSFNRMKQDELPIISEILCFEGVKEFALRLFLSRSSSEDHIRVNFLSCVKYGYMDDGLVQITKEASDFYFRLICVRVVLGGEFAHSRGGDRYVRSVDLGEHKATVLHQAAVDKSPVVTSAALKFVLKNRIADTVSSDTIRAFSLRREKSLERRVHELVMQLRALGSGKALH